MHTSDVMQMGHFIFGKNIHAMNEERNHDFRRERMGIWVFKAWMEEKEGDKI